MNIKPILISFVIFTTFMFLLGLFLLNPERSVTRNLISAVVSGVLYILLMALFEKFFKRRKSSN